MRYMIQISRDIIGRKIHEQRLITGTTKRRSDVIHSGSNYLRMFRTRPAQLH